MKFTDTELLLEAWKVSLQHQQLILGSWESYLISFLLILALKQKKNKIRPKLQDYYKEQCL